MWISHNKNIIITCVLGAVSIFASRRWDYDVWEIVGDALNAFDQVKGHEIMFFGLFFFVGYGIDAHKKRRRQRHFKELAEERLQVMRATMTTVHDIVNNALNSLQFFRFEAQKHSSFSPDAIEQFDGIIFDTADRLKSIQASKVFTPYRISEDFMGIREN